MINPIRLLIVIQIVMALALLCFAVFIVPTIRRRQFRISSLFLVTTIVAIALAILRVPMSGLDKMLSLILLSLCVQGWLNRNYLHPLQGTIAYPVRRRIAIIGFVGWGPESGSPRNRYVEARQGAVAESYLDEHDCHTYRSG